MPIHPSLTYVDLEAAISFLGTAFGFDLVDSDVDSAGQLRFASMRYVDGLVLLQPELPDELHGMHVGHGWAYVEVPDVEAHFAQAAAAGATVLGEPHTALDATARGYSARDPEGNLWSFVQIEPLR